MNKKNGLGMGLNALFSVFDEENTLKQTTQDSKTEKKDINLINIQEIFANPNQPRKIFEPEALQELASSIKQYGIVQPIVVVKNENKYMIIAGERRFRAAKMIGLTEIPCVIKDYTERQIKEIALIENLQRENLNVIESAKAIKQLMEEYALTQEALAERIGKSRPYITNLLRILQLPLEVIKLIEQDKLSLGHAKVLLSIENNSLQIKLANLCAENSLSVRELEKYVKNQTKPANKQNSNSPIGQSREICDFTNKLQQLFSTKVTIAGNDNKGKITIDYFSRDDLDRIYQLIELIEKRSITLQDLSNFNKRH